MTIRHDRSAVSIVTTCSQCPHWFAFNFDPDLAEESAVRHRINVHDMPEAKARNAQRERARRSRHAVIV